MCVCVGGDPNKKATVEIRTYKRMQKRDVICYSDSEMQCLLCRQQGKALELTVVVDACNPSILGAEVMDRRGLGMYSFNPAQKQADLC